MDATNLIACSACAKAKAKCDKRLPTCSRCLYKRLKCEPRPPRRYPDAFQFRPPQSQPQPSPPASSTPSSSTTSTASPANPSDGSADDGYSTASFTFGELQWQQPLQVGSSLSMDTCPRDMAITSAAPSAIAPHFPLLDDADFMSAHDSAMDFEFHTDSLLPSNAFSTPNIPATTHHALPLLPAPDDAQTASSSLSQGEEEWPAFRCHPAPARPVDPKTGSEFLRRLEATLNDQSVWDNPELSPPSPGHQQAAGVSIEPVPESLRDKLMVISQGFLSRARDVHRAGSDSVPRSRPASTASFTGFFILPPASVLESFLRTYATRVELYIPFFPAGTISLAKLVASDSEKLHILMLLLMIAHGAMGYSMPEAQYLASGLLETCRICMSDTIEKNVQLSLHPVMLRCSLLYLYAGAWSGNKWHMDLASSHLRLYTSILRQSRILNARKSSIGVADVSANAENAWEVWKTEESLNRLTYSWVILDQEINLFQDHQPDLEIHELNAPLPHCAQVWSAPSAEIWHRVLNEARLTRPQNDGDTRHSLAKLFEQFMSNELSDRATVLSLTELRLLLHPLQALIYHLNKSLVYFCSSGSQRLLQRLLTQLDEAQYLLKQWYGICNRVTIGGYDNTTEKLCSTLVIFHVISLNAITYFPDIERFARGEMPMEKFFESWAGKRCSEEAAQTWTHCGQVLRYFRQMPVSSRPYWWSASIYRAALCMWATSLASAASKSKAGWPASGGERIAIDALPLEHPSIVRYLRHQDSIPMLSTADGTLVELHNPVDVIRHCREVMREKEPLSPLDEGISTRLSVVVDWWTSSLT